MLIVCHLGSACTARGKKVFIKCHCSTDQYCQNYVDPNTGKPLNFNFLPIYADPALGLSQGLQ
jgi:hypothetical protein